MANNFDLQEQEQLEELKHFWKTWGNLITWTLIVILGAFAAWNGWRLWQGRQAQQATALAEAVDARVYMPMSAVLPRQRAEQVSPWTSRAAAEATEAMAVDAAPSGRVG